MRAEASSGFGLSNDERRGPAAEFAPAFRIAARAGLLAVPHGGELAGPDSVHACLEQLNADRIGHGVRAADDPGLTRLLAARGTILEVCPTSNVALGVAAAGRRRAAAHAAGRRGERRARRRRPAALWRQARRAIRTRQAVRTCAPTPNSPSLPASRCTAQPRPPTSAQACWPGSTPGSQPPGGPPAPPTAQDPPASGSVPKPRHRTHPPVARSRPLTDPPALGALPYL